MKDINEFDNIKTRQIDADLSNVVDKICKQYEVFIKAFQKEAIQNAWDARLDKQTGKNWKIKFDTFKEGNKTHLIIEDFGTSGMDEKKWRAFTSLWRPEKGHLDAGGQGQGKFVLMKGSKQHIIIAESINGKGEYSCRHLQDDRKADDSLNLSIKNFIKAPRIKSLNHQGTKIWVYDVAEKFLDDIQSQKFFDSILESWWRILSDPFNAEIITFNKRLEFPQIPSASEEVMLLENEKIKDFGKIKKLVLRFHEENLPKIFRGIKIQRAHMMVRKVDFKVYEQDYQNRFSGYIEFENDLESSLKDIEKTDHCSFQWLSPWVQIKKRINDEVERFIDTIVPKKKKRKEFNVKGLDVALQKANQIIKENCPELRGRGTPIIHITPKKQPPLQIKYLTINIREPKYGDIINPSCKIFNDTKRFRKVTLATRLKKQGNVIDKEEYKFKIGAYDSKLMKLSAIELKKRKYVPGKYTLRVIIQENRHDIHGKATSFYLETERNPVTGGFVKRVKFVDVPQPLRNFPRKDGIIKINFAHKDFENITNSFKGHKIKQKRQILSYIIKICIEEAINEILKLRFTENSENEDLDDLIREISQLRDKMYHDLYI